MILSRVHVVGIAGITAISLFLYLKKRTASSRSCRLPPSTQGLLKTLTAIVSPQAPMYLLEQARSLGPVFRVRIGSI
jgi:hypothetical protein